MTLNEAAFRIVEQACADADRLQIVLQTTAGVRVVDCGVKATGGIAAGIEMARAAMAGLGRVWIEAVGAHGDSYATEWLNPDLVGRRAHALRSLSISLVLNPTKKLS